MIMLVFGASAFADVAEDAYVPMIREGRVWEYTGACDMYSDAYWAFHYMKFDGTAEINGVEYHKFVLFKTLLVDRNRKVVDRSFDKKYVYYLREEVGKVYVLYDSRYRQIICQDLEAVDGLNPEDELKEFKVYDFTLSDGEKWAYPPYLINEVPENLDEMEDDYKMSVRYETPLEVEGEKCRVMSLSGGYVVGDLKFIEGIGTTWNGHLAVPNLGNISGLFDNSDFPGLQSSLNRVFDAKGNVIYTRPDALEPPANDGHVPTIREDRVWCYWGHRGPMYDDLLHYIHFAGTVEVGGKTYHKGLLFKTVKYDYVVDQNAYIIAEETERDVTMYYLREEEGKVYQLQRLEDRDYPTRVYGTLPENPNPDDYCEGIRV